jgi:hypothetical protein
MYHRQTAVYENSIPEEELPVRAGIKVIRRSDPDFGLSEDEIADRNEFIRCYLMRDFELLMMLPGNEEDNGFFIPDCHVTDEAYSAFNTVDFQKTLRPFDKYGYAMKKILDRVWDLAILHSAISHEEGRQNIQRRFNSLVENEFRGRLLRCVDWYNVARSDDRKAYLKKKIGELNRRIIECKKIWEQYAPWDA